MKRYSVDLTAMQWGMIGVDIGRLDSRSDSTDALIQIIKLMLEHVEDPEMTPLPYNVEETSR